MNEVEISLNVLCAMVLNGVGGEVDGANAVTADKRAPAQRSVKLLK
jgi:hypothetical protein